MSTEKILEEGEKFFLPINEELDKKCYEKNNIENWAECFYTIKSGFLLQRYRQILSKTENAKFFEALNYEYGINNFPLDTEKAFKIYKTAADTSTDTLSMYRLYRIYKKDFKKFNIKKRNLVLEKFYLMKCYTYLVPIEKDNTTNLYMRIDVPGELFIQMVDENNKLCKWCNEFLQFLYENHKVYNLSEQDVLLVDWVVFTKLLGQTVDFYSDSIQELEELNNPEALYNIATMGDDEKHEKSYYIQKFEKLYKMNYYRSFNDYVKYLDYGKDTLNIIKKSLVKGYFNHIKTYQEIFFMINTNLEEIFKVPELKSEIKFIISGLIDSLIVEDLDVLHNYIYLRKISIKHFNFGDEFKNSFDFFTKEIVNYLIELGKGENEENKKLLQKYFLNKEFYKELYTKLGKIYYYGLEGIVERNSKEALNKLNCLEKNDDYLYDKAYHFNLVYHIKLRERNLLKKKNEKNDKNKKDEINNISDEELETLQKDVIGYYYNHFDNENIKNMPPSIFYILSKYYSSSSINNEDVILEYVLLNRAANAPLLRLKGIEYDHFEERYLQMKAKKKLQDKNKEENFQKIKLGKGAINVEGYGEDGTICPVCFVNKKSTICLPCKHFFCDTCLNQIINNDKLCAICRADIKITFNIDLKKEKLLKSILTKSYE